jgi:hypothetical protein
LAPFLSGPFPFQKTKTKQLWLILQSGLVFATSHARRRRKPKIASLVSGSQSKDFCDASENGIVFTTIASVQKRWFSTRGAVNFDW